LFQEHAKKRHAMAGRALGGGARGRVSKLGHHEGLRKSAVLMQASEFVMRGCGRGVLGGKGGGEGREGGDETQNRFGGHAGWGEMGAVMWHREGTKDGGDQECSRKGLLGLVF